MNPSRYMKGDNVVGFVIFKIEKHHIDMNGVILNVVHCFKK